MSDPSAIPRAPWNVSPDTLAPLDAAIVRFISDGLSDDLTDRLLGPDGFAVRRRLAALMKDHAGLPPSDLVRMPPERRRALAETIILAEVAAVDPKSVDSGAAPTSASPAFGVLDRPGADHRPKVTRRQ